MKQKVRKFQYVATPKFSFSDFATATPKIAAILPSDAVILGVTLLVTKPSQADATLDVGLNASQDLFLNDISLAANGTHTSSVKTITKERSEVVVLPSKPLTQGEFSLIVEFALPTTYDYEV
ncbi:hypothetical protein [Helicobacter sp. T3_23-1056]